MEIQKLDADAAIVVHQALVADRQPEQKAGDAGKGRSDCPHHAGIVAVGVDRLVERGLRSPAS